MAALWAAKRLDSVGRATALEQREQFGFNYELLLTGAATSFNTTLGKWESTMDFDWGKQGRDAALQ